MRVGNGYFVGVFPYAGMPALQRLEPEPSLA